jgi:hypothetical protein
VANGHETQDSCCDRKFEPAYRAPIHHISPLFASHEREGCAGCAPKLLKLV